MKLNCGVILPLAEDILKGTLVAIKIEHSKCAHPQLEYEAKVYKYLAGIRTSSLFILHLHSFSWNPIFALLWPYWRLQCNGHGLAWAQS